MIFSCFCKTRPVSPWKATQNCRTGVGDPYNQISCDQKPKLRSKNSLKNNKKRVQNKT